MRENETRENEMRKFIIHDEYELRILVINKNWKIETRTSKKINILDLIKKDDKEILIISPFSFNWRLNVCDNCIFVKNNTKGVTCPRDDVTCINCALKYAQAEQTAINRYWLDRKRLEI